MKEIEGRYLPDREIAYRYTAAMLFSQETELNLKAILYTIDHSFVDLEDTLDENRTHQPRTFDQFLIKATSGLLQEKMRKAGVTWPKKVWKIMDEAVATRNRLAHDYLQNLNIPAPNEEQHEAILDDLNRRVIVLYQAMRITRETRNKIEKMSEEQHERLNDMMREFGVEPSEINKGLWQNKDQDNEDG